MDPRLRFGALLSVSVLICGAGLPAAQRSQGTGAAPAMAITGRVLDSSGTPVADTFVTALRKGGVSGSWRFRSATGRARQANLERRTGRSRVPEYESPGRTRKAPKNTETGLAAGFAPFSRRKRGD
jgi:hypothetical protein